MRHLQHMLKLNSDIRKKYELKLCIALDDDLMAYFLKHDMRDKDASLSSLDAFKQTASFQLLTRYFPALASVGVGTMPNIHFRFFLVRAQNYDNNHKGLRGFHKPIEMIYNRFYQDYHDTLSGLELDKLCQIKPYGDFLPLSDNVIIYCDNISTDIQMRKIMANITFMLCNHSQNTICSGKFEKPHLMQTPFCVSIEDAKNILKEKGPCLFYAPMAPETFLRDIIHNEKEIDHIFPKIAPYALDNIFIMQPIDTSIKPLNLIRVTTAGPHILPVCQTISRRFLKKGHILKETAQAKYIHIPEELAKVTLEMHGRMNDPKSFFQSYFFTYDGQGYALERVEYGSVSDYARLSTYMDTKQKQLQKHNAKMSPDLREKISHHPIDHILYYPLAKAFGRLKLVQKVHHAHVNSKDFGASPSAHYQKYGP
ncbi:MAG: hypothetical protein AAF621_03015 [Pseudomonadota bacterium]